MLELIRVFLMIALCVYAYYITMRYNMHMFQLNGYKNDEHINWLKKNIRLQWVLIFSLILGIADLIFPCIALDIILYLVMWLIIVVYRAMRRLKAKKKLVYTARVKRMITTIVVVSVMIVALVAVMTGLSMLPGLFVILVSSQLIFDIVANVINKPVEKAVKKHYINDAKRKLKSVPGLTVIGVTGSYGKTSVKFYLQTLLQEKYSVLVTPESFNTPMGVVKTIRGSLKSTHQIFICEMGARRVGEIKEICDIVHPQHGIITSIGPQHLETFFSMENIQKTKFELADEVSKKKGLIFLNGDNSFIKEKAGGYENTVLYYSNETGEGYQAKNIRVSQFGTEFTVTAPDKEEETYQMKLIGAHNVINVVGAIAVAHELGIKLSDLKVAVRRIQPVPHRMQMRENGNVTIIDDAYNSNPVGSKAAVETLAMFEGNRILITPGMVELGEKEAEYNYKFGTYAAKCCDYILLVGKKHTAPIREGVLSEGFPEKKCHTFDKLEEALTFAYGIKAEGHKYILLENDLPDNY